MRKDRPHTPDGRYFVARGMLRRCTNPNLPDAERRPLIKTLMQARMAMPTVTTRDEEAEIRALIDQTKTALGESGPTWWTDGAPDLSGEHPVATIYEEWWNALPDDTRRLAETDKRRTD